MYTIGFNYIFFFISPIAGFLFHFFPRKITICLLTICAVLFFPILLGYKCSIHYFFEITGCVGAASLYALVLGPSLERKREKIIISIGLSVTIFFFTFWTSFFSAFGGSTTVNEVWNVDSYRVELLEDAGFSGGHLFSYHLEKYTWLPIYYYEIDEAESNGGWPVDDCIVNFAKTKAVFDKCTGKFEKLPK